MIRINLMKGASFASGSIASGDGIEIDGSGGSSSEEASALRKTAIQRAVLIALGPILLFAYESQHVPDLKAQLNRQGAELNAVRDKNNRAKEAVVQTARFKKDQAVLQAQINSIESLKKDRLREVKVLDFIQRDMPEKMWMTRIELMDGKLNIQGMTTTDGELTLFMENLSHSAYLREVSLVKSTDFLSQEFGSLKKFEINCFMEKAP